MIVGGRNTADAYISDVEVVDLESEATTCAKPASKIDFLCVLLKLNTMYIISLF